LFQLDGRLAHAPQIAPSPIGYGNGNPQQLHHGGAKKVIAAEHLGHRASGSPTVAPQARQRGGNTPSTTARVSRRNRVGRVAASCIAAHHQSAAPGVKLQPAWIDRILPLPHYLIAVPGDCIASVRPGLVSIFFIAKWPSDSSTGST
jgi:hypothetical protein